MSFGNTHLHWKAKPAMWFPGTKKQKQKVRYVIVNPRVLLIVNQEVEIIREKIKKEFHFVMDVMGM
jgi:predicted Rdx family selenoprotein